MDVGPADAGHSGPTACPGRTFPDAGIETAALYVTQGASGAGLYAQLPAHPLEGVGQSFGCYGPCRIEAAHPIDAGIPDYGPNRSTGTITVQGASGGALSAGPPDYTANHATPVFADDDPLTVSSVGDPSGVPAIQASLRNPVGIDFTPLPLNPSTRHVDVDRSRDLELQWTRTSSGSVGTVQITLRGNSDPWGWQGNWSGYMHRAICTFDVDADRAVIPRAVLATYEPGWVSFDLQVVERVTVGVGGGWDARIQAGSLRTFETLDLF